MSANRFLMGCCPLVAAPPKYEQRKGMTLQFNPRKMVGQ